MQCMELHTVLSCGFTALRKLSDKVNAAHCLFAFYSIAIILYFLCSYRELYCACETIPCLSNLQTKLFFRLQKPTIFFSKGRHCTVHCIGTRARDVSITHIHACGGVIMLTCPTLPRVCHLLTYRPNFV